MDPSFQSFLKGELQSIREQGLIKEEWPILGEQGPVIRVEGRAEPVLNFCANNYLGLSSHPELLKAAHAALDEWGYGLSSVRFICGTQALHLELEKRIAAFLGMRGRDPVRGLLRRERRRVRAAARRGRRASHRPAQPRLDHRRRAPLQGQALRLRERDMADLEAKLREAQAAASADRRPTACSRWTATWRRCRRSASSPTATAPADGGRQPRHRLHGPDRPRHLEHCGVAGRVDSSPRPSARRWAARSAAARPARPR
jgi:hypothetical protein